MQLVDVAWTVLVLLGIEKVRIVPGITAANPLDLYYMPYTHSLVAAMLWALAASVLVGVFAGTRRPGPPGWALRFCRTGFSILVHRPDLPLYDDTMKVGLGLWNHPALALALEAVLLFGGMILYLRTTRPINSIGRFGPLFFGIVMLAIQGYIFFGPPPVSPAAAAVTALVSYGVFALVAQWLARQRRHGSA